MLSYLTMCSQKLILLDCDHASVLELWSLSVALGSLDLKGMVEGYQRSISSGPSGRALKKGHAGPRGVNFKCVPLLGPHYWSLCASGLPVDQFWIESGLTDKPQ